MNFPTWATDQKNRVAYLLRLAALHHNPSGSIPQLAIDCGISPSGMYYAISNGTVTPGMASAVELVVGRDVVTREMLCPSKFA